MSTEVISTKLIYMTRDVLTAMPAALFVVSAAVTTLNASAAVPIKSTPKASLLPTSLPSSSSTPSPCQRLASYAALRAYMKELGPNYKSPYIEQRVETVRGSGTMQKFLVIISDRNPKTNMIWEYNYSAEVEAQEHTCFLRNLKKTQVL